MHPRDPDVVRLLLRRTYVTRARAGIYTPCPTCFFLFSRTLLSLSATYHYLASLYLWRVPAAAYLSFAFVLGLSSLLSLCLSFSRPSSAFFSLAFLSFPSTLTLAASRLWARRRYHRGNRHSIRRDESILFPAKNKLLVGASRERATRRNAVSLAVLSPLRPFSLHSLYVRVWLFFNRSFALAHANCAFFSRRGSSGDSKCDLCGVS